MPIKIRNRFRHDCKLPAQTVKDFELRTPYDRWYHRIWCYIRESLSVSRNSLSALYVRSRAECNKEKLRHLTTPKYRHIIHPLSTFVLWKNIFICTLWLSLLFTESFILAFTSGKLEEYPVTKSVIFFGNIITSLDVASRFFTGYTIDKTREVILEPKAIVWKYLKTYFVIDVCPIISNFLFAYHSGMTNDVLVFVHQLHRMRLLRLVTITENGNRLLEILGVHQAFRVLLKQTLLAGIFIHTMSAISKEVQIFLEMHSLEERAWRNYYLLKHNIKEPTPVDFYILEVAITSCHLLGVPHAYKPVSTTNRSFFAVVLIMGVFLYVYTLARMLNYVEEAHVTDIKFTEMMAQVEHYMHKHEFKYSLRRRITSFYDFHFNTKFFNERKINEQFSEHLRMEVLLYSCQNFINTVAMFKGLSKDAIGTVLALLKHDIYVPGDVVMHLGDQSGSISFILYGTCAVRTVRGNEIMHLEDGNHFTSFVEYNMSTGERLLYSIVALEMTEVYALESDEIAYCCEVHPEIDDKLKTLRRKYTKTLNLIFEWRHDEFKTEDILEELRIGNILHAGIRRTAFLEAVKH